VETGLHYNYFRYFNPQTGRYITPDPIGLEGGINLFVYTNNPVNYIDPFGLHEMYTSKGREIKHYHRNEIPWPDPTKSEMDTYTKKMKEYGAKQTGKGGYYENCHGDAYRPKDDVWIDDPSVIIEDDYTQVVPKNVQPGDTVTYYLPDGTPWHSGTIAGKDEIESKHGSLPKYKGPASATDKAYPDATIKKYYRKIK